SSDLVRGLLVEVVDDLAVQLVALRQPRSLVRVRVLRRQRLVRFGYRALYAPEVFDEVKLVAATGGLERLLKLFPAAVPVAQLTRIEPGGRLRRGQLGRVWAEAREQRVGLVRRVSLVRYHLELEGCIL